MSQASIFLQLMQNLISVALICLATYVCFSIYVDFEEKRKRQALKDKEKSRRRKLRLRVGRPEPEVPHLDS